MNTSAKSTLFMKTILALALGLPIGLYAGHYILTGMGKYGEDVINMCASPMNIVGNNEVDHIICLYITMFKLSIHDILGNAIQWVQEATFGVALTIMLMEATRRDQQKTPLAWIAVLGTASNAVGISCILPAVWVPMITYYTGKLPSSQTIPAERSYGNLAAVLVAYMVPTAVMIITGTLHPNTSREYFTILCWHASPLVLKPVSQLFSYAFESSSLDRINDAAVRKRIERIEARQGVERVYRFLGVLNVLIYAAAYLHLEHQGINLKEALVMIIMKDIPTGISTLEICQFLASHVFLVDYFLTAAGFTIWALVENGVLPGLAVALGSVLVGPGAAAAFYAAYREGRLQSPEEKRGKKDQ